MYHISLWTYSILRTLQYIYIYNVSSHTLFYTVFYVHRSMYIMYQISSHTLFIISHTLLYSILRTLQPSDSVSSAEVEEADLVTSLFSVLANVGMWSYKPDPHAREWGEGVCICVYVYTFVCVFVCLCLCV